MSIVNTDIPMNSARCTTALAELIRAFPFFRRERLGFSVYGRPIDALILGRGERRVMYSAAHHANEWITTPVLLKFAEEVGNALRAGSSIQDVPASDLLDEATIYLVPMVNPDGVDLVTGAIPPGSREYESAQNLASFYPEIPFPDGWKANLRGVDLNLQYPTGWEQARQIKFSQGYTRPGPRDYVGTAPLTQPEALALAQYTQRVNPALVLAYHSQGQVIYWQFENYVVPGARGLGEEFARVSGYSLEDTPYNSSFAGYKDWFIQKYRRPGYTIEVGLGENPLPLSQFDEIYRDNEGILVTAALGSVRS